VRFRVLGRSALRRGEPAARADGNWTVEIAANGISISVRQSIVIWTPKGVSAKLKAHEEGHRKLDEMLYKKLAESAARAAGAEMEGHRFTGEGSTAARATTSAVQNMFQQAGRVYLAQTEALSPRSTRPTTPSPSTAPTISRTDAMKQALERYDRDHSTTRPATETPSEKK